MMVKWEFIKQVKSWVGLGNLRLGQNYFRLFAGGDLIIHSGNMSDCYTKYNYWNA